MSPKLLRFNKEWDTPGLPVKVSLHRVLSGLQLQAMTTEELQAKSQIRQNLTWYAKNVGRL